jgi:hypothetical protein
MNDYYVTRNGQQLGPYEESEVLRQVAAGIVSADDLCWREGMPEWRPIASVLSTEPAAAVPEPGHAGVLYHQDTWWERRATVTSEAVTLGRKVIPLGEVLRVEQQTFRVWDAVWLVVASLWSCGLFFLVWLLLRPAHVVIHTARGVHYYKLAKPQRDRFIAALATARADRDKRVAAYGGQEPGRGDLAPEKRIGGSAPGLNDRGAASPEPPADIAPSFRCPFCGTNRPPRVSSETSQVGWILFVALLFCCLPLCWLGLLVKEPCRVCGACGRMLG